MDKIPASFTTVTPLSKAVAMILLVLLPFIGFYLGMQYSQFLNEDNYDFLQNQPLTVYPTEMPTIYPTSNPTVIPTIEQPTATNIPDVDRSGAPSCSTTVDCPVTLGECHPSNPESCLTAECISGKCVYSN